MPKKHHQMGPWHGGLNDAVSHSVIQDYELAETENVVVELGAIHTMGEATAKSLTADPSSVSNLEACWGCYAFYADVDMPTSGTITEARNPFLCLASKGTPSLDCAVWIYGDHSTTDTTKSWAKMITFGTPSEGKIGMYYANGGLRAYDANFNYAPRTLQYINRTNFPDSALDKLFGSTTDFSDTYDEWYEKPQSIDKPTYGIVGNRFEMTFQAAVAGSDSTHAYDAPTTYLYDYSIDSDGYICAAINSTPLFARDITDITGGTITTDTIAPNVWDGKVVSIFPPPTGGLNLTVDASSSTGTFEGDDYEFGYTFVYYGNQESLIYKYTRSITLTVDKAASLSFRITKPSDRRVTGFRVYCRKQPSGLTGYVESWGLIAEIDFANGIRTSYYSDLWRDLDTSDVTGDDAAAESNKYFWLRDTIVYRQIIGVEGPSEVTYEVINGYSSQEMSLKAKYKAATVCNGRAFIANVKIPVDLDANEVAFGDRIMYSPVHKYDVFPTSFFMGIVPNDGDEFIALVNYADRLLAFKKRTVYIINVSKPLPQDWFVEDKHERMGVDTPAGVTVTDEGVLWVNTEGVYFYNGDRVVNLTERSVEGVPQRIIDVDNWSVTALARIGYEPDKRRVYIFNDADSNQTGGYILDLRTGAWSKSSNGAASAFGGSVSADTNIVTYEDEMVWGRES